MEKDNSNIQLIYEYAQQVLKDLDSSKNTLNTKLGTVIGFDAVMIRFSSDLPDDSLILNLPDTDICLKCNMCLILKILTLCSLIISLLFGLWGFKPKKGGTNILPQRLIEKCLSIPEENYRRSLIEVWNESIIELDKLRNDTAKMLNRAVFCLGFAAILSALDVMLVSILK
ncbi:hypothetical protein [Okeania sp.]|uniref:hypothetical protein n=1 Tax=Okeania sp. TaxID=3100323 RepID=UPI002B4B375A|nr:hypothetical protein [Okeania sp.]MEB3341259.1 hypothetical protein [Okeania sp.]